MIIGRIFRKILRMLGVAWLLRKTGMLRRIGQVLGVSACSYCDYQGWVPAGHYYSPVPDQKEIEARADVLFEQFPERMEGIDMNEQEQLSLLESFKSFYPELPFSETKTGKIRYQYDNNAYCHSDAICLYSMIRHLKPKRIIEVGCGWSSCVTMDTNELFFDNRIDCTFVDPYTDRFLALINEEDKKRIKIVPETLQTVSPDLFCELEAGDILFVDSTHVTKIGSDVNRMFFDILPVIKEGVYIHFHDIFFPFEYPREWLSIGRWWNEAYLLRAFLQYNEAFKIVFFNTYLEHFFKQEFEKFMPLCLKNPGGSIWLRKEPMK
jgi:Methyltransferase domain